MVLSPLVGFVLGYLVMVAILWIFRKASPARVTRGFRHGADGLRRGDGARPRHAGRRKDDGRHRAGPRRRRLPRRRHASRSGCSSSPPPILAAGTYAGGWRIMRTLGRRIIELDPPHGFAAESTGVQRAVRRRASATARRSRPPTRSPRRSWASARPSGSPRCAGASPATSSSPGSSPSRRRPGRRRRLRRAPPPHRLTRRDRSRRGPHDRRCDRRVGLTVADHGSGPAGGPRGGARGQPKRPVM